MSKIIIKNKVFICNKSFEKIFLNNVTFESVCRQSLAIYRATKGAGKLYFAFLSANLKH